VPVASATGVRATTVQRDDAGDVTARAGRMLLKK
jgi:hypothetical protein